MQNRGSRKGAPWPIIIIASGVLIVLGALLWQVFVNTPRRGAAIPTLTDALDIPYPEVQRIGLQDAKAAYDQNQAVFVDVRTPDQYAAGHIPGAVNIPLADFENRMNELDPNQWIITYCT